MKYFVLLLSLITCFSANAQISQRALSVMNKIEFNTTLQRIDTSEVSIVRLTDASYEYLEKKSSRDADVALCLKFIRTIEQGLDKTRSGILSKNLQTRILSIENTVNLLKSIHNLPQYDNYISENASYKGRLDVLKNDARKQKDDSLKIIRDKRWQQAEIAKINERKMLEGSSDTLKTTLTDYERVRIGASINVWHHCLTPFIGYKFIDVHMTFITFLFKYFDMYEENAITNENLYTYIYKEKITQGKPKQLIIKYYIKKDSKGDNIINKVDIGGDGEKVIDLFIKYWPTKIQNSNLKKNEWAYCFLGQERIGMLVSTNGKVRLKIERN